MENLTFKTFFFRLYDRKIAEGSITFSQIGMSKNDFTKLCTEPDFVPDIETIERVCLAMRLSGILRDNKTYMKKADTQVSNLSTGYQPFYYEGNITVRCFRNIDKSTFRSSVHSCSTALCAGAKRIPRKIHHHTFKSS